MLWSLIWRHVCRTTVRACTLTCNKIKTHVRALKVHTENFAERNIIKKHSDVIIRCVSWSHTTILTGALQSVCVCVWSHVRVFFLFERERVRGGCFQGGSQESIGKRSRGSAWHSLTLHRSVMGYDSDERWRHPGHVHGGSVGQSGEMSTRTNNDAWTCNFNPK